MAALANGGSADDITKGIDFFNELNTAGNFLPLDPTDATIKSGQTPVVIDWSYNQASVAVSRDPRDGKLDVFTEDDYGLHIGWYRVDDSRSSTLTISLRMRICESVA